MFFLNRLFSVVIVFCLCVLISTQQVHTKNKPDLLPLTGETCTEGPGDTEENLSELSKKDVLSYSEMRISRELKQRKKIDKEFIERVKAVIDSRMRELRNKKISRSRIHPLK